MASEDDFKTQNEKSLSRQRATRKRRAEEKRVEDLRDEALDRASGSKERRAVRAAGEEGLLSMLGRQSQQGGIYDVETGASDSGLNKEGTDDTIQLTEEMTKTEQGREKRRREREERAAGRKARLQGANERQRNADIATYGAGSMLLESKSGNVYDVETGQYDPTFNKEGTDETLSNDGVDEFLFDNE